MKLSQYYQINYTKMANDNIGDQANRVLIDLCNTCTASVSPSSPPRPWLFLLAWLPFASTHFTLNSPLLGWAQLKYQFFWELFAVTPSSTASPTSASCLVTCSLSSWSFQWCVWLFGQCSIPQVSQLHRRMSRRLLGGGYQGGILVFLFLMPQQLKEWLELG